MRTTLFLFFFLAAGRSPAQDPSLPVVHALLDNMPANTGGQGIYFINHLQVYSSRSLRDANGNILPNGTRFNSVLTAYQLLWHSGLRTAGGNLFFSVILPGIKTTEPHGSGTIAINDNVTGDLLIRSGVQWQNKKFFGHTLDHLLEISASVPSGAYNTKYTVNPSIHSYLFSIGHAFTYHPAKKMLLTAKNRISYSTRIQETLSRPGIAWHLNYTASYLLLKNTRAGISGYYIKQVEEDVYAGSHRYYSDVLGIADTKEQVFSAGPVIQYSPAAGYTIETKIVFETGARNRSQGTRTYISLLYQLDK